MNLWMVWYRAVTVSTRTQLAPQRPLTTAAYNLPGYAMSDDSISSWGGSESDDGEFDRSPRSGRESFISIGSEESGHAPNFDSDAALSILDSLVKGDDPANMQLELTALRMSTNASEHQLRRAIATAFIKRTVQLVSEGTSVREAIAQVFVPYKDLITRAIFDKKASDKADQVDFMVLLQSDLSHRENGDSILMNAATKLIELDVIEEEGMIQWWGDARSTDSEELKLVRQKTSQLIDYLNESSEEESDDEDDDDDEDSE